MKNILIYLMLLALAIPAGCGPKKPDGLPKLTPCTITITQAGKPLAETTVALISKGEPCRWSVGGLTDATGTATIRTHGQYDGVPTGMTFAVLLTKTETDQGGEKAPTKVYAVIDPKYTSETTSPLEIVVENKRINTTFDLEEFPRTLIETIAPYGSSDVW